MTEIVVEPPEIEHRSAQLAEVNFAKRLIELIVVPYERAAEIVLRGRLVTEVVSRGAFDGIERRSSQIRANRDHQRERTVGRAVALHPSRREGLVAEVKISRTPLGEETLVLADDGVLDASAGFGLLRENGRVKAGAEVWETRDRRRLNHLFLDHIALVPDPAYEDAKVLAVRAASAAAATVDAAASTTPNLAALQLLEQRALLADIDRRYGLG